MNNLSQLPTGHPPPMTNRINNRVPNIISNNHPNEEDDSDDDSKPEKRSGRRKIKIEFIEDKSRRHITFSKRKAGIMKKAYELSTLTGTQVLLLVVSETGLVYTFTTPKLQPLVTKPEGKNLIQACLNAPDTPPTDVISPRPTHSNHTTKSNTTASEPVGKSLYNQDMYDRKRQSSENSVAGYGGVPIPNYPQPQPSYEPANYMNQQGVGAYPAYSTAQPTSSAYYPSSTNQGHPQYMPQGGNPNYWAQQKK
ncbi:SRF-type transcription factor (DNA-binding and dimerization domain)-domain-containing protein [Radiomyces spectabilis]|uniref:SRF-type transcription factor (DNA-binding and dimerization domain)-domain-containing protein n=1 Tax=Radiomyces spectabilis TaxID=64574 RepID=UPI00221FD976|nr:SRF-type transcription factor (DNA-binding and dimerization domain)-domain-containing protein [Radiomyces spectabilis]KAI8377658.1 SRF-type transcription factor (DNA-binding and dimerization domain)-domain-containing protein [Radiomyces spectabilis]